MQLKEIGDNFLRTYKRECFKREIKTAEMGSKSIAIDISEAQQDIQRRLSVLQSSTTITTELGYNNYNLPSNFGKQKIVSCNDVELVEKSFDEIIRLPSVSSNPSFYALNISGRTQQIIFYPTPNTAYTIYVHYFVDLGYYSPAGETSQNWGSFDGVEFFAMPKLPERYDKAINLYMMAMWFPDYENKYESEIRSLRESRVSSLPQLKYNMGGYTTNKGIAMTQITTSPSSSSSAVSSDYIPEKWVVLTYDHAASEGSRGTIVDQSGFDSSCTISDSGGVITLTSPNAEFSTKYTNIQPSNTMTGFSNNAGACTITPPASTSIICRVEVYSL